MNTPIADFVRRYAASGVSRMHMPGHKGRAFLGCEAWDITEIAGADSLYEADGVIAQSETNASALFGSRRTFYATEGSSQCIRAMLRLLTARASAGGRPLVLAARNAHKAFVYAAALLDLDVRWLAGEGGASVCSCPVTPNGLRAALDALPARPAAVYVTSPDYLGGLQDVAALADVCHARGVPLAVDNAHGAYLRFLSPSLHPLDLGADICCDSAHKTLPVLTGGAYLHIAQHAPRGLEDGARHALALFGSTSPSYLTLASLDLCNAYLADGYPERLAHTVVRMGDLKDSLCVRGWRVSESDPLRLTLDAAASGADGTALACRLREGGVECEFADADDLVLMATPENGEEDFARVLRALGENRAQPRERAPLPRALPERVMTIREAMLAPREEIPVAAAVGRVCGAPTVSCPPAVPVAACGERFTPETLALLARYGVQRVEAVIE